MTLLTTLKDLAAKATPGPWRGYSEPDVNLPYSLFSGTPMVSGFEPIEPLAPCDIDLIVTLRNALPEIIAMMEREEAREAELAAVKAERDGLREAITSLLALGPDHDDWCGIGPIYNCTCDLHPVRQAARQALKGTVG